MMHLIVHCSQDQKSRHLLYVVPSFAYLRPVLTHWAGENLFNPGKIPTLLNYYWWDEIKEGT